MCFGRCDFFYIPGAYHRDHFCGGGIQPGPDDVVRTAVIVGFYFWSFDFIFFLGNERLINFALLEGFSLHDTPFYILFGAITGLASVYFTKMYFAIKGLFEKISNTFLKVIIGSAAIGLMLYFIPPLYGEGFGFINNLLQGNTQAALGQTPFDYLSDNVWVVIMLIGGIIFFKAIAMTTTLMAGGAGGVFIPTMVMGSALGNVFAKIVNNLGLNFSVSESNFTLIGMAGLIAGVIHAPLTAIFLIAEITGGYQLFVPLMISASISYLITKNALSFNIYTKDLADKGALLTHDKDKTVLTVLDMKSVIERDFIAIKPDMTLGAMLKNTVAKSARNIFPVINEERELIGIVLLDDVRDCMFKTDLYETMYVRDYMHAPPEHIYYEKDNMEIVMRKFQRSAAWNLPVIKNGEYHGFISKSKLLTAYRETLINRY